VTVFYTFTFTPNTFRWFLLLVNDVLSVFVFIKTKWKNLDCKHSRFYDFRPRNRSCISFDARGALCALIQKMTAKCYIFLNQSTVTEDIGQKCRGSFF